MAGSDSFTTDDDLTSALTVNFSETVRALSSAGSVEATLALVLHLAVDTIEGCDFAGIFLLEAEVVTSPRHTDPLVSQVDDLQRQSGEGPCMDALRRGVTYYVDDLAEDVRWPTFRLEATRQGIRSVLALPLLASGSLGALNLYARYPRAFGAIDRARGLLLAALAGLAVTTAKTHEDDERRATDLHGALATREIIGQAQGILMERERISADQAFDILRRASQHLNRKLREVAQTLVDTGENPDTGPTRHPR
jgi:GAF domain-containing protein